MRRVSRRALPKPPSTTNSKLKGFRIKPVVPALYLG